MFLLQSIPRIVKHELVINLEGACEFGEFGSKASGIASLFSSSSEGRLEGGWIPNGFQRRVPDGDVE